MVVQNRLRFLIRDLLELFLFGQPPVVGNIMSAASMIERKCMLEKVLSGLLHI